MVFYVFFVLLISNVHKSIIVINSFDTAFPGMFFEGIQKLAAHDYTLAAARVSNITSF